MTDPFFAIIIPTYNNANVIRIAIDSVLKQSFQNFEIIIVDDGSTDDSREIIRNINDIRIKYYHQTNAGPSTARNHGAQYALAKYLIFLDSDDRLNENYLRSFHEVLTNKESELGLASALFINEEKNFIKKTKPWKNGETFGPVLCGSYVISKNLFQSVNGFDPKLFFSENSDLFLRIRSENKINIDSIILNDSVEVIVATTDRQARYLKYSKKKYVSVKYFLQKHKTFFDHSLNDFVNFKRIHSLCALQNGYEKEARQCLVEIMRRRPYAFKVYLQYLIFLFPKIAKSYYGR